MAEIYSIQCPVCRWTGRVSTDFAGKRIRCKRCTEEFTLPHPPSKTNTTPPPDNNEAKQQTCSPPPPLPSPSPLPPSPPPARPEIQTSYREKSNGDEFAFPQPSEDDEVSKAEKQRASPKFKADDASKRKRIKNYFDAAEFPTWAVWLIVLGIPLTLVLVGLVLIFLGVAVLIRRARNQPSDRQIDEWFHEDRHALYVRALREMGLEKSQLAAPSVQGATTSSNLPLEKYGTMVWGPYLMRDESRSLDLIIRQGKDKRIRVAYSHVNIIYYTAHQLLTYACIYDHITGDHLFEEAEEYFYKDIVSVSAKTARIREVTIAGLDETLDIDVRMFVLTTSGATQMQITMGADEVPDNLQGYRFHQDTTAENKVRSIRDFVRSKKMKEEGFN